MELKAIILLDLLKELINVSNSPCGVERFYARDIDKVQYLFLIHRVELKE